MDYKLSFVPFQSRVSFNLGGPGEACAQIDSPPSQKSTIRSSTVAMARVLQGLLSVAQRVP